MPYTPKQKIIGGLVIALILVVATVWSGVSLELFKGQVALQLPAEDSQNQGQTPQKPASADPSNTQNAVVTQTVTVPAEDPSQGDASLAVVPREGGDSTLMQLDPGSFDANQQTPDPATPEPDMSSSTDPVVEEVVDSTEATPTVDGGDPAADETTETVADSTVVTESPVSEESDVSGGANALPNTDPEVVSEDPVADEGDMGGMADGMPAYDDAEMAMVNPDPDPAPAPAAGGGGGGYGGGTVVTTSSVSEPSADEPEEESVESVDPDSAVAMELPNESEGSASGSAGGVVSAELTAALGGGNALSNDSNGGLEASSMNMEATLPEIPTSTSSAAASSQSGTALSASGPAENIMLVLLSMLIASTILKRKTA